MSSAFEQMLTSVAAIASSLRNEKRGARRPPDPLHTPGVGATHDQSCTYTPFSVTTWPAGSAAPATTDSSVESSVELA